MKTISNSTLEEVSALEKKTILGRVCRERLVLRENPVRVTIPELPVKPVKPVYQWRAARIRDCETCGEPSDTVFAKGDIPICARCADAANFTAMETYADELLSALVAIQTQIAEAEYPQ